MGWGEVLLRWKLRRGSRGCTGEDGSFVIASTCVTTITLKLTRVAVEGPIIDGRGGASSGGEGVDDGGGTPSG